MNTSGACKSDCAVSSAHAALLKDSSYQFEFAQFHPPQLPAWMRAIGLFLAHHWPILKWGVFAVAALILLLAAYATLRRYLPGLRRREKPGPEAPMAAEAFRPAPEVARELLRESDALAAAGQFGDAVHLLLLRSVQDIRERRPNLLRPQFTSREIGRLDNLPQSVRKTFTAIAQVVERTVFAGNSIGATDFAFCRNAYERFAFSGEWQEQS